MRFLYVNKILDVSENQIIGEKIFEAGEPLRQSPPGRPRIEGEVAHETGWNVAPGVISEAIGQLASWCVLKRSDFVGRPVFMFADRIEFFREVKTGEKIILKAELERFEDKSMVFSGTAESAAGLICRIVSCHCHLVDLAEMEDPELTKARFESLCGEGENYGGGPEFFVSNAVVERRFETNLGKVSGTAKFGPDSFFYRDHFPRRPVTPIVMINEVIGELTKSMCSPEAAGGLLLPRLVDGIKIKSFVLPGEVFVVDVDLLSKMASDDGGLKLQTAVQVRKESKLILRGRYSYEWRNA